MVKLFVNYILQIGTQNKKKGKNALNKSFCHHLIPIEFLSIFISGLYLGRSF